jgi:hypothetical protein
MRDVLTLLDAWVDVLDVCAPPTEFLCTGRDVLGATSAALLVETPGARDAGLAWATRPRRRRSPSGEQRTLSDDEQRLLMGLDDLLVRWRATADGRKTRWFEDGWTLLDGAKRALLDEVGTVRRDARAWADDSRSEAFAGLIHLIPGTPFREPPSPEYPEGLEGMSANVDGWPVGLSRYISPLSDVRGEKREWLRIAQLLVAIAAAYEGHEALCMTVRLVTVLHSEMADISALDPVETVVVDEMLGRYTTNPAYVAALMDLAIVRRASTAIETMPDARRRDAASVVRKLLTVVGFEDEAGDIVHGARLCKDESPFRVGVTCACSVARQINART